MSGMGIYDPTTIMNADELNRAQKEGWIKLAFYLLSFFFYLYRYVISLYFYHYAHVRVVARVYYFHSKFFGFH